MIPYRPEAGTLVLFPILQGKSGRASFEDSISGSPILRHPNQEGIKWTCAGVGHARGHLRGLPDALFISPGFAQGHEEDEVGCRRGSGAPGCLPPSWAGDTGPFWGSVVGQQGPG